MKKFRTFYLLISTIILGFFLRLYNLGKYGFWLDEVMSIYYSRRIWEMIRHFSIDATPTFEPPLFGLLLHFTGFGRKIYAIGSNPATALYAGIAVDKIKLIINSVLGLVAGLSGILLTSRIGSARPDIAQGNEMAVITICLLGGIYIFGGRGSIVGVVISSFIVGYIYYGLAILRVQDTVISIITGCVLITALVVPTIISRINEKRYISSELRRGKG